MAARFVYLMTLFYLFAGIHHPLQGTEECRIKAIVFDFGGVIARTDRQALNSFVAESLNITLKESDEAMRGLKAHKLNDGKEIAYWENFAASKGKQLPNQWLEKLNNKKFDSLIEIPGMVALVKALKEEGYQTALLSNVSKSQAKIKRKLGLYELFHPAILSYEIGTRKPDPKAYRLILKKLNLPAEQVLFVDNKPVNVQAAKSLGMEGVVFKDCRQLIKALTEKGVKIPSDFQCD